MSTNYYAHGPDLPEDGLHIGQHALGWEFLFRSHPKRDLSTVDAWYTLLSRPDVVIYAESGYGIPLGEFWADAVRRPAEVGGPHRMRARFGDRLRSDEHRDQGRPFLAAEFH